MVHKKCNRCHKGFRTTKSGDETLCASCEVRSVTLPKNFDAIEEEFMQQAEKLYGRHERSDEFPLNTLDVFDHGKRLRRLQEQFHNGTNPKERQRNIREVDRILEEHEEVQKKIEEIKEKLMKSLLLSPTRRNRTFKPSTITSSPPKSNPETPQPSPKKTLVPTNCVNNASPAKDSDDDIQIIEVKLSNNSNGAKSATSEIDTSVHSPVKKAAAYFEENIKRSSSFNEKIDRRKTTSLASPRRSSSSASSSSCNPLATNPAKSNLVTLTENVVVNPPTTTTTTTSVCNGNGNSGKDESDDANEEEASPLKRSNSVKNRIQAFEALVNRRASTGSWDRKTSKTNSGTPRRKLQF